MVEWKLLCEQQEERKERMSWGYHLRDLEPAGDSSFPAAGMKGKIKGKGRCRERIPSVSAVLPLLNSAPKF